MMVTRLQAGDRYWHERCFTCSDCGIRLRDTKMRGLVVNILKAADLPTQYVDSVQEKEGENNADTIPDFSDPFGDEGFPEQSSTGFSSTDKKQPLVGWLQANVDIARYRWRDIAMC